MSAKKPFQLGAMYWQNPNFGYSEVEEDMRRIKANNSHSHPVNFQKQRLETRFEREVVFF